MLNERKKYEKSGVSNFKLKGVRPQATLDTFLQKIVSKVYAFPRDLQIKTCSREENGMKCSSSSFILSQIKCSPFT